MKRQDIQYDLSGNYIRSKLPYLLASVTQRAPSMYTSKMAAKMAAFAQIHEVQRAQVHVAPQKPDKLMWFVSRREEKVCSRPTRLCKDASPWQAFRRPPRYGMAWHNGSAVAFHSSALSCQLRVTPARLASARLGSTRSPPRLHCDSKVGAT